MTTPQGGVRLGRLTLTPDQRRRYAVALERHLLVLKDLLLDWRVMAARLNGPELADLRDLSGLLASGNEAEPSDREQEAEPCFMPGKPSGDCETTGHYLCRECAEARGSHG